MWDLRKTNCTGSTWATPPPAATTVSFDDRHLIHPMDPVPSSPCEEEEEDDISITASSFTNNPLGHSSAPTSESSCSRLPPLETAASSSELITGHSSIINLHLWSHFLLSDGASDELDKYQPEIRDNPINRVPVKNPVGGAFEQTACDYLKKLDGNSYWGSSLDKDFFSSTTDRSGFNEGDQRLKSCKFSDMLAGDWSISAAHEPSQTVPYPCRGHDHPNVESEPLYQTATGKYAANAVGLHHQIMGDKIAACGGERSLADLISFGGQLIGDSPLVLRPNVSPNIKKRGLKDTSQTGGNGREQGSGAAEEAKRKKRSCEESSSETKTQKRQRRGNPIVVPVSTKLPIPKTKLGDRIATLQQIVSPFGKTDTASVLMESIAYIKFLQEQVELLISNPYLKTHPYREYTWGGLDPKEAKLDLKSRGLCLVPTSWAPQTYCENMGTGSDYWAPPYRGALYR